LELELLSTVRFTRGSTEASGEIGHMIPGREFLGKSYIDFGALESVASATSIAKKAGGNLASSSEEIFCSRRAGQSLGPVCG